MCSQKWNLTFFHSRYEMNNVNHNEDHVRRPLQDAAELETLAQDSELELRPKINNNCNGGKAPEEPVDQLGLLPRVKSVDVKDGDEEEEEEEEAQPPPDNGASFLIILFFYFQVYRKFLSCFET